MGYRSAVRDIGHLHTLDDYVLIADEATAFKNSKTQVHQTVAHLAGNAKRVWALTATLIKNHLIEGWAIYKVLVPNLFASKNRFMNHYCIVRMQTIKGGRRQIPIIVGYRKKDVEEFRQKIDPFFLGRPKFKVASELPPLTTSFIEMQMSKAAGLKYSEALSGLLEIKVEGELEEKEVSKLTAVIYCQQIVNHLRLIGHEGESTKLKRLIEILTEGDLANEKVIIFSRFRKMVDIIMETLKKNKIEAARITGSENEAQRDTAQTLFQDPESEVRAICITMAGAEAINLQAAKAIIFFDTPWSAGDYIQILGRMIRIGSTHDRCHALHLMVKGSIDSRVMEVLNRKMSLVEQVLGKRIKGDSDDEIEFDSRNDISDLFEALKEDARKAKP
jgi:SWI/SNF-related matrix-associated actin-dependent regulator 1 of chromatin subfamily A